MIIRKCGEYVSVCGENNYLCIYIKEYVTGSVRGLLCPNCNNLLGNCLDNIIILEAAIVYLKDSK